MTPAARRAAIRRAVLFGGLLLALHALIVGLAVLTARWGCDGPRVGASGARPRFPRIGTAMMEFRMTNDRFRVGVYQMVRVGAVMVVLLCVTLGLMFVVLG